MSALYHHLIRANFLERIRRYSFLTWRRRAARRWAAGRSDCFWL